MLILDQGGPHGENRDGETAKGPRPPKIISRKNDEAYVLAVPQDATSGESIKAIQQVLGHRSEASTHKYAHLGSRAQLHVVESLVPAIPPHARGGS